MPRFAYRAKDHSLHVVEGAIEAENETAAISRLGTEGMFPISIEELGDAAASTRHSAGRRISQRTLAQATQQLADLLGGGLPLLSALTLLSQQTEQLSLRRVIESLADLVRDGRSLSEAMTVHPGVFPPIYRSLVQAGELGGGLEAALDRLAQLGEHEADLRSRVLNAFAYPLFVLALAAAMTVFLLAYVIPKLSLVFLETGQLLPLTTRILLGISGLFTRWWWLLGVLAVVLGLAARRWYGSPSGKAAVDRTIISVPAMGTLVRKLETARFARTLGTLLGQGVPILQALEVVTNHVSNATLRQAVGRMRGAVRDGSSLAGALSASGQFPAFVGNMVFQIGLGVQ
jgi:type II secretory pathway component PulF